MTAKEISTKIFYSPATNGQAESSIEEGEKMIMEYANRQEGVIKEAFDSIPKEVRDRHIKAAYDENERIRKAAEMVVSLYDKDTGDSVVEWTYALRNAIKELEKALKQ